MSMQNRSLVVASIFFAVLWTVFMIYWNAPSLAGGVILAIAGAIAGTLWFFAMRWWMTKFMATRQ